jgi:hypothetical protein
VFDSSSNGSRFLTKRLSKTSAKVAKQLLRTARDKEAQILRSELSKGAQFQAWSKDTTGDDRRVKPFSPSVSSQMGVKEVSVSACLQKIEQRMHLLKMRPIDFYHCCLSRSEWTAVTRVSPSLELRLLQAKQGYVDSICVTAQQFRNGLAMINIQLGPEETRAVLGRLVNGGGKIEINATFGILAQLRGRLLERSTHKMKATRGRKGKSSGEGGGGGGGIVGGAGSGVGGGVGGGVAGHKMALLASELAQGQSMNRLFVNGAYLREEGEGGGGGGGQGGGRIVSHQRKGVPGGPHLMRMQV